MRRALLSVLLFLFSVAMLLLASPYVLYRLGLSGVEGFPQKPVLAASREQQARVWSEARGVGTPHVTATNPYLYAARLVFTPGAATRPGELIAWQVASRYLMMHRRYRGTAWWHLSGAALTIWLSRNWTEEEILSAAWHAQQASVRQPNASHDRHGAQASLGSR